MKLFYKLTFCFIVFFILSGEKVYATDVTVNSRANIAMEMNTGKILYEKNSDEKLPIASVAKIITMYQVLNKVNTEGHSWDEIVPIDNYLIELSHNYTLGSLQLSSSHQYTLRDLFNSMVLVSSNSATMALGNWVASDGAQTTYINETNQVLSSWGLTGFTYVSASGLENSDIPAYMISGSTIDQYNQFSAKDVSVIAQHLIKEYPEILEVTAHDTYMISDGSILARNGKVYAGKANYDSSLAIDGLKTGFTSLSGVCFVGTEYNGDFRTITVVLNSSDYGTETNQLMHYARENYQSKLIDTNSLIEKSLKVKYGQTNSVSVIGNEMTAIVNKSGDNFTVQTRPVPLTAPIKNGKVVEYGRLIDNSDSLGYVSNYPIVTALTTESVNIKLCLIEMD